MTREDPYAELQMDPKGKSIVAKHQFVLIPQCNGFFFVMKSNREVRFLNWFAFLVSSYRFIGEFLQ